MSTVRKMLENQKAKILSDAQKRAAEIDSDMAELERLTAKYGLSVAEADTPPKPSDAANGAHPINALLKAVHEALVKIHDASVTQKARAGAEAYIRAKKAPATLNEIYEVLEREGIKFQSDTPKNTLSAVLGQTDTLFSISREKGWWLKDEPIPLFRRV